LTIATLGIYTAFAQNPQASRAENIGTYTPNSSGVYPVRVRWQKFPDQESGIQGYHVFRSANADSGFEKISTRPVERESGGFFVFIDENPGAVPGKPCYYRIQALNSKGEAVQLSQICIGYGALSHESYLFEFCKSIKSSYEKLTLVHKTNVFSKLGSEIKDGSVSGSLLYEARVAGLGGRVIMKYENYSDYYSDNNRDLGPCFILTGDCNTSASITQNGKMDGTVLVSGMYPGRVYFEYVQIKNGKPGGGTYGVEPNGFPRVEVSWTKSGL